MAFGHTLLHLGRILEHTLTIEVWLAFVAACTMLAIIPGPGMMNVVGYAVSSGRAVALRSVLGMTCGDFLAVSLSMAGLGAVLSASATAFEVLKLVGVGYLLWLGASTIYKTEQSYKSPEPTEAPIGNNKAFWSGFLITALHPKTIIFAIAFLPQFIDHSAPYAPQAAILAITFCSVIAGIMLIFAVAASSAERMLTSRLAKRWMGHIGGSVLIGSGLITAFTRPTD